MQKYSYIICYADAFVSVSLMHMHSAFIPNTLLAQLQAVLI